MSIKNRLTRLEQLYKGGDQKIIIATEDSQDPERVIVEGQSMTWAEYDSLEKKAGPQAKIILITYGRKVPPTNKRTDDQTPTAR